MKSIKRILSITALAAGMFSLCNCASTAAAPTGGDYPAGSARCAGNGASCAVKSAAGCTLPCCAVKKN